MNISFNIIASRRKIYFIFLRYLFLVSIIIALINIPLENKSIYLIFTAIGFVSGLIVTYSKGYHIIGEFMVYNDNIKLIMYSNNQEKTYNLNQINRITIYYDGYKNEPEGIFNPRSIELKKGINNYIVIEENNNSETLEILLTRNDLHKIDQFITECENKGLDTTLIEWGKKVKKFTY